jgi:hypothetical protein
MVVIVPEQVQQAVEREDSQLFRVRVSLLARLAARDACRDHDIPQSRGASRVAGRERQDVGRTVLPAVASIEGAHASVADERDRDCAAGASGRNQG